MVVFGIVGALLGLLVVLGGETSDGITMVGIGAVLTATGWPLRGPQTGMSSTNDRDHGNDDDYDTPDSGVNSDSGGSND